MAMTPSTAKTNKIAHPFRIFLEVVGVNVALRGFSFSSTNWNRCFFLLSVLSGADQLLRQARNGRLYSFICCDDLV